MDNKIIISKSKLIKSLNFSESNRLILGTSGEGQPIHWKREMIMDEYANIGAAKISDSDKWIVINSDSNELTFVPKDKNDTELVICKNVCLKKNGEDTHVLLIFQKSGELLSKARKYIKSNNDRFYNLALDLRPGVKEQINQESDVEVQQLIDKILQVESEEELSLYDRIIARLLQSIILYFLETGRNDGLAIRILDTLLIKDVDVMNLAFIGFKNDSEAMKQWNVLTETLDRHMLKSIWDNATKYALEYMIKNVMKLEQYKKEHTVLYITGSEMSSDLYMWLCTIMTIDKFIQAWEDCPNYSEYHEYLRERFSKRKKSDPLSCFLKAENIRIEHIVFADQMKNADRHVSEQTVNKLIKDMKDTILEDLLDDWIIWKVCDFENYKGIANAKYSCKKIGFSKYIASIRKENLQEKQKRIANMISIKEEKKIRESADTFNQYVGCEDILLIRASVPSFYMCYYVQELKQHEMIVEAKPDFFNSLYCIDIYIKIKKD